MTSLESMCETHLSVKKLFKSFEELFDRLKAVDTIGNRQRLAFTVGVSQHMHKITNL